MGNCACPDWCEYLDHNDPLCTECKWNHTKDAVHVYKSNYPKRCDKCGGRIKPFTEYTIEKQTVIVAGRKETEFKRYHYPECPERASRAGQTVKSEAS